MANKTLNNVKINMTLKSTTTRAKLSTSSEDLAVQMGKINKWYDSLVPTGGETGNILGWNSDGTAKWVTVAPSANKLNVSSAVGGTSQPVYFKADGTPEAISFTIEKSVPSSAVFTDTKVTSSANHYTPSTASGSDETASASGATAAWGIDVVKGVTLNTDGKGHVTGISVESGKIPANPVPSNNVTGSGTSGYLTKWNGTNTITNGPQLGSSTTTYLNNAGNWATPPDTKNTAGSTDTSSKIYLIGATSQATNPQTYSDNEVYTTSGVLTTKKVQVGGGSCTMEYNSTTETLDFVFV